MTCSPRRTPSRSSTARRARFGSLPPAPLGSAGLRVPRAPPAKLVPLEQRDLLVQPAQLQDLLVQPVRLVRLVRLVQQEPTALMERLALRAQPEQLD